MQEAQTKTNLICLEGVGELASGAYDQSSEYVITGGNGQSGFERPWVLGFSHRLRATAATELDSISSELMFS